jgi:DNA-directed RNA polymerase specialized sigma24 family protein
MGLQRAGSRNYGSPVARQDPFEELEPFAHRVHAYVSYRTGTDAEAEQLTGAAFERAHRHRKAFDARRDDALLWLLAIARSIVVERDLRVRTPPIAGGLRGALVSLTPHEQDLIALRYGADLELPQIAALLQSELTTVDTGLRAALRKLNTARKAGAA